MNDTNTDISYWEVWHYDAKGDYYEYDVIECYGEAMDYIDSFNDPLVGKLELHEVREYDEGSDSKIIYEINPFEDHMKGMENL